MQNNKEKQVLIKVMDLRQYFPLKQKGKFVKANDGITLDIYQHETFGLVGESGCGKSTLGRTLLQLYQQTSGRTMYYGVSRESIAPAYVEDTLKNLKRKREHLHEQEAKEQAAREEIAGLLGKPVSDQAEKIDIPEDHPKAQELFEKLEEYYRLRRTSHDAYLDIVQIIGGFIVQEDLEPVAAAFMKVHNLGKEKVKIQDELQKVKLDFDSYQYMADKAAKEGKAPAAKGNEVRSRLDRQQAILKAKEDEIKEAWAEIDRMAKQYKDNADFARHDSFRDDGIDLARLKYSEMRHLRKDLQLIFQDPYSSLNPRMTVGQIIGEALMAHGMFKKNDERLQDYILRIMDECGLAPYMLHRYPHQFSGGQRQRIGIARSLALRPKFVVCDEAVSALDVSIQSQILNLLMDLKEEYGLTYMFISHDLSVVKYISDRIGVMYLGNIVEMAPSAMLFSAPRHPYTEALLKAIPTTDPESKMDDTNLLEGDIPSPVNPPKGCKFHTRCQYATDICRQVTPVFEEVEPGHIVACHHQLGK